MSSILKVAGDKNGLITCLRREDATSSSTIWLVSQSTPCLSVLLQLRNALRFFPTRSTTHVSASSRCSCPPSARPVLSNDPDAEAGPGPGSASGSTQKRRTRPRCRWPHDLLRSSLWLRCRCGGGCLLVIVCRFDQVRCCVAVILRKEKVD